METVQVTDLHVFVVAMSLSCIIMMSHVSRHLQSSLIVCTVLLIKDYPIASGEGSGLHSVI